MDTYIFQAALYCTDCANEIKWQLDFSHEGQPEHLFDSGDYPKGPYPASESDTPDHCDSCHVHLENPLTGDGEDYVREALSDGTGNPEVLAEWRAFYSYLFTEQED